MDEMDEMKEIYSTLSQKIHELKEWYEIPNNDPLKNAIDKALLADYEIEFNPNGTAYKVKDGRMTKITEGEDE